MTLTWICELCGWANDDNIGRPCRNCGGLVEEHMFRGRLRRVVVKQPWTPNTPEPPEAA